MSAVDIEASRLRLLLDEHEAPILAELASQLMLMLRDTPDDPAAAVLFPVGYEVPSDQAEFSRYTHGELSERKLAAAQRVAAALSGPAADGVIVTLSVEEAWDWLTFLTDIRLVLAERLAETLGTAEDRHLQQGLFDWAAYLQGALVEALAELAGHH